MTRVQRREDVAENHPKSKRLTQPRDNPAMMSATMLSQERKPRTARRMAATYSAANSQSEFHHAAVRAVKQTTNQSHATKVSANAASPKLNGRAGDAGGIVI